MNRHNALIEAEELLQRVKNENIRIFDATITDDAYLQKHIPGAVYFDHERFSDSNSPYMFTIPPEGLLEGQIGRAGISNDSEVIVYACGMLPYAIRAWWVLKYAGLENVRILNGGFSAWEKAGGRVEQEARQYEPANFKARFNPSMLADKDEVLASMDKDEVAIVNVLPQESYEASHISGSINVNCMELMQGDFSHGFDYLLPNDDLALRLKEVSQNERIITYCGGGIAAAVNALAHLMIGHKNVAVYDGSMYEWLAEKLPTVGTGKWEVWVQQ
ncbi:MAG: sulfurtransferase [Chloroflexi bacterium]|nr:sulfurtransferase [Chloroflexota bacterium]